MKLLPISSVQVYTLVVSLFSCAMFCLDFNIKMQQMQEQLVLNCAKDFINLDKVSMEPRSRVISITASKFHRHCQLNLLDLNSLLLCMYHLFLF